ncbi:biotin-dependent carboxyltransferase family protein [Corynebacterium uropygiale]|uniref:Biotin-dependent carboxyltransferase family protein n=1 Tax=Corynebacterium uropygiale TaxID=1775911 RepID=A0A9X1QS63_9CORY|nr:biotin-dependent carboxyltransferase family protein [Corynebacterium uropygiale]MCF4006848.1 biotin-dependent carboxyltransferase family protein [Corynebacterium uropygiale]
MSSTPVLRVLSTGPQLLLEDRGRPGRASLGVSPSGSFDRLSAARANHALGNTPDAAVLEILLGGCEFEVLNPTSLVVTGTDASVSLRRRRGAVIDAHTHRILDVATGDRLYIEPARYGLRAYLGIRGGFLAQEELGSRSTDTLSGLGPTPLAEGDVLSKASDIAELAWWPALRTLPVLWRRVAEETLTVIPGPREDWFEEDALDLFYSQTYEVSQDSNRVGLRLTGDVPLGRRRKEELPSEGMVRGSIQVPPNGQPVVFGPDHPVTGGYPVIAVLTSRSCDRSAQLRPGDRIRFRRSH